MSDWISCKDEVPPWNKVVEVRTDPKDEKNVWLMKRRGVLSLSWIFPSGIYATRLDHTHFWRPIQK